MNKDHDYLTVTEIKKIIAKQQGDSTRGNIFIGVLLIPLILTTILLVTGLFEPNPSYPKYFGSETTVKWIILIMLLLVIAAVTVVFLDWLSKGRKIIAKIKKNDHDCPVITNYSSKTLVNTDDGVIRVSKWTCIVVKKGYFEYSDGLIWTKKTIDDSLSLVDAKELYVETCGTLMIYSSDYSIDRIKSENGLGHSLATKVIKL
jgi:hypothetical protein